MIRAMIKSPGEEARMQMIPNQLETFQGLVGGYIEVVEFGKGPKRYGMIINEEGKLQDLDANFIFSDDMIVGPAVFIQVNGEEFGSIEDEADLRKEILRANYEAGQRRGDFKGDTPFDEFYEELLADLPQEKEANR